MSQSQTPQDTLVSCQWLSEHLDDPQVRIINVSSNPEDTAYREGHIPGAVRWFWKDYLWHPTDREFATPEQMARQLGSWCITRHHRGAVRRPGAVRHLLLLGH